MWEVCRGQRPTPRSRVKSAPWLQGSECGARGRLETYLGSHLLVESRVMDMSDVIENGDEDRLQRELLG